MLSNLRRSSSRLVKQQIQSSTSYKTTCPKRDLSTLFQRIQAPTGSAQRAWMKSRKYSTERDRAQLGVFTPASAGVFLAAGFGLYFYFRHEKQNQLEAREKAREARAYGRPAIGGPFTLSVAPPASSPSSKNKTNETEEVPTFSEKDMMGKWTLLYFGFTNCPDICPAEMDKMGEVIDTLDPSISPLLSPVFVTVDPARDYPQRITEYLRDFHPKFVGLYGTHDEIKKVCKTYRVYFSTPADADPEGDYLVDHSIFIYLIDPRGEFVEAFGQATERPTMVERIEKEVKQWENEFGKKV